MNKSAMLAALATCVAACAAPAPRNGDSSEPSPPPAAEPGAAAAEAENDGNVIEVVEVPKAAAAVEQPQPGDRRERVCRREKRTGTNRIVRVCRSVAQIEQETIESKRVFDEIRRSQREYDYR